MKEKLKKNLFSWLIYTILMCLILSPFGFRVCLALGLFFSFLNEILTQLRKLNGEKFE